MNRYSFTDTKMSLSKLPSHKTIADARLKKAQAHRKLSISTYLFSESLVPPPQLIVDHFSVEELHSIMCHNHGQILGLFDEMSSFYGQLDLYKHSSTIERKTLLSLNGGGPWTRTYKSYSASMEKTAFNISRFIQPAFVYEMLNEVPDADGLNDRQLFDFPPERELFLNDLKVPMPLNTPDLLEVFLMVHNNHSSGLVEYSLEGDAYTTFQETHDHLVTQKLKTSNENAQGILSKVRGYCARIAMVIHSLEQSLQCASLSPDDLQPDWKHRVTLKSVQAASEIVNHLNQQKFIMLALETDLEDSAYVYCPLHGNQKMEALLHQK